jgi:hypothetical protein
MRACRLVHRGMAAGEARHRVHDWVRPARCRVSQTCRGVRPSFPGRRRECSCFHPLASAPKPRTGASSLSGASVRVVCASRAFYPPARCARREPSPAWRRCASRATSVCARRACRVPSPRQGRPECPNLRSGRRLPRRPGALSVLRARSPGHTWPRSVGWYHHTATAKTLTAHLDRFILYELRQHNRPGARPRCRRRHERAGPPSARVRVCVRVWCVCSEGGVCLAGASKLAAHHPPRGEESFRPRKMSSRRENLRSVFR